MVGTPIWIWLLVSALGGVGLALALWALLWDRPRGRRRCPKCWHELAGVPADAAGRFTCPECGRAKLREHTLSRTRRRWRWVIAGVLLVAVAATAPRIHREGWIGAIPIVVLVSIPVGVEQEWLDAALWDRKPSHWLAVELHRRSDKHEGELAERVWRWRVERALLKKQPLGISEETRILHDRLAEPLNDELTGLSLQEAFDRISEEVDVPIVVDWDSLARFKVHADDQVRQRTRGLPVSDVLDTLSRKDGQGQCGVTWCATVEEVVVAGDALRRRKIVIVHELEFLELVSELDDADGRRVSPNEHRMDLLDLLMDDFACGAWRPYGGKEQSLAVFGDTLFIEANPSIQLQVEDLLVHLGVAARSMDAADPDELVASAYAVSTAADSRGLFNRLRRFRSGDGKLEQRYFAAIDHLPADQQVSIMYSAAGLNGHFSRQELRELHAAQDGWFYKTLAGYQAWSVAWVIYERVDPDCWEINGGRTGAIRWFDDMLWISTTPQNHRAIAVLLDELREQGR